MNNTFKSAFYYALVLSIVMISLVAFARLPTGPSSANRLNAPSFQGTLPPPPSATPSLTPSRTPFPPPPSQTASLTPSQTPSQTPTASATNTQTSTRTNTPTSSRTNTVSSVATLSPTATSAVAADTATNTPVTPFVAATSILLTPALVPAPTGTLPPTGSPSVLSIVGLVLVLVLLGARFLRRTETEQ